MNKINKGEQYIIPIDSFCALDYKFMTRYFLKEAAPEARKECFDNLMDAYDISLENGEFPFRFYERGRRRIFKEHQLPSHITVEIIKKQISTDKKEYYKCKELYTNQIFLIPDNLLNNKDYPLEKIIREKEENYVDIEKIESLLYLFYTQIHTVPKKENIITKKRRKK